LIDWCLMPTLAIFQLYHGVGNELQVSSTGMCCQKSPRLCSVLSEDILCILNRRIIYDIYILHSKHDEIEL